MKSKLADTPGPTITEQTIFAREPGRLGIRIPRSAWKAAGHSASAAMRQKGTLVGQGQLADWVADDLRQVDDEVVCYGPGFSGLSLEELLQSGLDQATKLQRLTAVARALNKLDHETGLPTGIQSAGILVSDDGTVLVLPPALVSRAAARTRKGEGPTPESNPAIAVSVMLAGILRRILSPKVDGNTRASADNSTDSAAEAWGRKKGDPFVPLGLIAPHLDPLLATLADHAMDQTTASPSLEDWTKAFEEAGRRKYFRELVGDELASLELQRKATATGVARKLAFKRFLGKRGSLLAGLAIAGIVIGGIAIFDRPAPGPDLSGLGPKALIQAYYEAIDTMDLETLDACLEGRAGKDDKSLVTNLTVVMKMRQAYSPEAPYIGAEDWVNRGSPELLEGTMLYGITGLQLHPLPLPPAGQSTTVAGSHFEARYTLWTTESYEDRIRATPTARMDRLVLAEGKQGWKIIAIERKNL